MSSWIHTDDGSFSRQVLQSTLPVVVVFGAEWSGPSRQVEALVEQICGDWDGRVRLAKVDVDRCTVAAQQFQIKSLPTVVLFLNGEARQRISGKQPPDRIIEKFSPFLNL